MNCSPVFRFFFPFAALCAAVLFSSCATHQASVNEDGVRVKESENRITFAERREAASKERAERERERTAEREQRLAERRERAEERREALLASRREERREDREVPAAASRSGGGFFSSLAIASPSRYRSRGHEVKVNQFHLAGLNPSNARIEIDISEQKARVYKRGGATNQLVIETRVSTGKPGHSTPTGTYRIHEKLTTKRSSLYGSWVDGSGRTVQSSGDSRKRPAGGMKFVGAEMPYWMRINGGIGMHVGYVPDGPASHGCIRVPEAVQPLIYSKVGVGTTVSIVQ